MKKEISTAKFTYEIMLAFNDVEQGISNPLDLIISLRETKKFIEDIESKVYDQVMTEAEKYNNQEYRGYDVRINTGSGRYTFDHIPEIRDLQQRIKTLQELAKHSYKLKEMGSNMVDEDGVEVIPAHFKPSKSNVALRKKGA